MKIRFKARPIGVLNVFELEYKDETFESRIYLQIDVIMWIPFTPILFIDRAIIKDYTGDYDFKVFWANRTNYIKTIVMYDLVLVTNLLMFKTNGLRQQWIPLLSKAKRFAFVVVRCDHGIPATSPRRAAIEKLRTIGYEDHHEIISKMVHG